MTSPAFAILTVREQTPEVPGGWTEKKFSVRPGLTVYAACRVNGVLLATGCGAQGRCGLCRVRVAEGDAGEPTEKEQCRLSEESRRDGERLACQIRVNGDLTVVTPPGTFAARSVEVAVEEAEALTHDIRRLRMRLPANETFGFEPGQYTAFTIRGAGPDKPGGTRCYSFASDPVLAASPGGYFDLIIRSVTQGLVSN